MSYYRKIPVVIEARRFDPAAEPGEALDVKPDIFTATYERAAEVSR